MPTNSAVIGPPCGPYANRSRHRRRGITLIEVMVVISIILVLIGLFLAGAKHWTDSANRNATNLQMEKLNAWLSEMQGGSPNFLTNPANAWFMDTTIAPLPPPLDASVYGNVTPDYESTTDTWIVGSTTITLANPSSRARAIRDTAVGIMFRLGINGNIAKELQSLPAGQVISFNPTTNPPYSNPVTLTAPVITAPIPTPSATLTRFPPVLLDGWNNPIIFVPASGLQKVYVGGSATPVIIQSPDNRPFWASAGPDGDFTRGDDNIYSFAP
jgi:prepilin-type N-terminal cleavage/methylation domain-containing protein